MGNHLMEPLTVCTVSSVQDGINTRRKMEEMEEREEREGETAAYEGASEGGRGGRSLEG